MLEYYENYYHRKLNERGFDTELAEAQSGGFKLWQWMAQYRLGIAKRGLFLYGPTGRGKTFHAKALTQFIRWQKKNAAGLAEIRRDGIKELERAINTPVGDCYDMIIDDLGDEKQLVNFGERIEAGAEIIHIRHALFENRGAKTIFTSNIPPDGIRDRYGDRVLSRLHEMCTFVLFGGQDLRKITLNKPC
jgi:DNA replication protein DnaC